MCTGAPQASACFVCGAPQATACFCAPHTFVHKSMIAGHLAALGVREDFYMRKLIKNTCALHLSSPLECWIARGIALGVRSLERENMIKYRDMMRPSPKGLTALGELKI